ncbi:uncharacterized [Tachysurus ichikawai]
MIFFGHPECERYRGLRAATCWETAFRKKEWGLKWELEEEKRGEEKDSGRGTCLMCRGTDILLHFDSLPFCYSEPSGRMLQI